MVAVLRSIGERFHGKEVVGSDDLVTVPNIVTLLGIIFAGLSTFQVYTGTLPVLAPVTRLLADSTDPFDGWLAEKLNQQSWIGKILDSVRDWVCQFSSLAILLALVGKGVSEESNILAVALLFQVILFCAHIGGLLLFKEPVETHLAGKMRMIVYGLSTFVVLVQAYWLGHWYIGAPVLAGIMAITSGFCLALILKPR